MKSLSFIRILFVFISIQFFIYDQGVAQNEAGTELNLKNIVKGKFQLKNAAANDYLYTICIKKEAIKSFKVKDLKSGKSEKLKLVISPNGNTQPRCLSNVNITCGETTWGTSYCICGAYVWPR